MRLIALSQIQETLLNIAINKFCPRLSKPVAQDSLTEYQGFTVGCCNSGHGDDFAHNINKRLCDSGYFDVTIKENLIAYPS